DKNSGGNIPVPVFDGTRKTMEMLRREVATWQVGTEVKLPKQGATLLASLKGKAEEACEEIDLETINGDDSVEVFLEYLGKRFPEIEALEVPALLETFVEPACTRRKFEEIHDFNHRFNSIATKLRAKDIQVPDEVLADLCIKGARLPPERAASVLNGVGNKFNPTKIQEQLMINLPKMSVVHGNEEHRRDKGGHGGHKKDREKMCAAEACDEAEDDGASTDGSEGDDDDLPDELQDVIDEAEEQVAFFAKKMARAKDELKEAKQDDAKIAKQKARKHCGARGQIGHWRGDPQCPEKNDPNARADIPRKGSHKTNLTTNVGAGDLQGPRDAEMTVAAVYQHEQPRAARGQPVPHGRDGFGPALTYIRVEFLLKESGGKQTFATACSRCVGGLDWHNDVRKKLAAFDIQSIEYPEVEPFRFGASKVVCSLKAALIPCSVNGKAFAVRMSIARSAVPGLFSRRAQSELGDFYRAGDNKVDIKSVIQHGFQMGLGRAGHPALEITGFAPSYKPVSDISDTKADESQSGTDCDQLDSAELFEQQVRQLLANQWPEFTPPSQRMRATFPRATNPEVSCSNAPTPSTSRLPAISSVRMGDLQAEVASYELDARDATCDQLRVIPRALRAEGQDKKAQDIPGLGKMHKHELQESRRMKGIDFDQHTTVPELRQRLKGWEITGSDKMRFGKYPTADHRWVLKNDLGYARWAVLELGNGRASPLPARFGRCVKAHGVRPLKPEKLKTTIEAVMVEELVLDDGDAGGEDPTGLSKLRQLDGASRQPQGKRVSLLYQVTGLLSAFAFQAVLTADWLPQPLKPFAQGATSAAQDVADHVRNVKEIYTVRSHGVDVMQVFGGEGSIAEAAVRRDMTATEVIDRKCGWDLRKQKDLEMTCERRCASRPKFASIELPCTHRANIAHLKFRTPQGKQALRRLWRSQLDSGGVAMVENPATGRIWTQRIMMEILADKRVYQVRWEMCEHGARRYKAGGLVKHPAKLLATHKEFDRLRRTCSHAHHDQTFGDNVAVRTSGVYPAKFCRAVVRVVGQIIRQQGGPRAYQVDCSASSSPFIATELKEQATACENDAAPLGETGEPIGGPGPMGGGDDFADTHDVKADETVDGRIGVGAVAFTKNAAACCKPAELAMLKRLHVNLGHPSNEDLSRSLPLKGAKSATVQAVKGLICGVRRSQQRPSAWGPARLHFVQDFGDDVGFYCFELKDVDGKSYWYLSIVDLATTFHVATLIGRHTSQEFATAFERCWASWAGVSDRAHFDMERGFGGFLSELFQSFDAVQLPIAGQAHWQLDRVERQRAWWKELAARTTEHSSIRGEGEMRTLGIMVSGAKNSLRRRAGFSPAQRVLGRDPKMPADLVDDAANYSARSLATNDEKIRRRSAIWTAARESFMRMQNDDQLRRAMLARARTVATLLSVGEMCYMFRDVNKKEQKEQHNRNAKKGIWRVPCVVISRQGNNAWVSLGGRAMLVAPEHIKALAPDDVWFPNGRGEIGQAVAELNRARDSLEQEEAPVEDIRPEPGQPEVQPGEMEQAWREFIDSPDDDDLRLCVPEDPKPQEQIEVLPADRADMPQSALEEQPYGPVEFRRWRATFDGADSGDFGPALKRLQTAAAKEQAGSGGPPPRTASRDRAAVPDGGAAAGSEQEGARERSRSAPREATQTSVVTERIKRKQADKDIHWRAIKDSDREFHREAAAKQWSEWQKYGSCQVLTIEESELVRGRVKANLILPSRFVYRDKNAPLRTDKRPLPVKAKARLYVGGHMDPRLAQGDLRADAPTVTRNSTMLFFTQLIKILKGVFGLAAAPRQWWAKLKRTLLAVEEKLGDYVFRLRHHSLDPAVYYGCDKHGELCAAVVAHVDDLLLGVSPKYPTLYDWLYKLLPKERKTELSAEATPAEFSDNRSALGALGWLSSQTRPDLSAGVAMGQRTQNKPTIQDLLETNRLIELARQHADVGLEFPKLRGPLCLVTYHDASWANVDEPPEGVIATLLTKIVGSKDKNIKIRSQAGYATFIAEAKLLCGDKARAGIVDWRSGTIERVCRSILAAETMSAVDALGCAQITRCVSASLEIPDAHLEDIPPSLLPLAQVTDCATLYDTMHKDGYPKLSSERRLLLDLVALKESLEEERSNEFVADDQRSQLPLFWVPTGQQLGDQFTQRSDSSAIGAVLRDTRLALQRQEPTDQAREHEAHMNSAGSLLKRAIRLVPG
ncbi:unnamed protein product, partial [Prorocentrum cordatum]